MCISVLGKSWMTCNVFGRAALTAAAETILRISCASPGAYHRVSYRFPGLFDRLHAMAPSEWLMQPHSCLLGQISNMSWVISGAFFRPCAIHVPSLCATQINTFESGPCLWSLGGTFFSGDGSGSHLPQALPGSAMG